MSLITTRDTRYSAFHKIVDSITDELQDMIWLGESKPRRRLKGEHLNKLKYSVEKLVRDSVAIKHSPKRKALASIHLGRERYKASTYNTMLTYRIHVERCFEGMIEIGYLRLEKKGYHDPAGNRFLTRYSATSKLLSKFPAKLSKALPVFIPQDRDDNIIRVQETFKKMVKGKEVKAKRLVEYQETSETKLMRDNLNKINTTLSHYWFDLRLDDEDFVAMQDSMLSKKQRDAGTDRQLNLSKRNMYRVFNDAEMTLGGRFYGGWWQEVPKGYRHYIVMNAKPMVEFDYANLHPRILYAEAGLTPPDDCYSGIYPEFTEGLMPPNSSLRKTVKIALNAMLNATKPLNRPPRGFRKSDCNCSWKDLCEAILKKHQPIADKFFTGQGLRLQRIDSEIAEYVMLHFAKHDMPILPLHDSFLIRSGYEESLEQVMQEAFYHLVGSDVGIEEKKMALPNTMNKDERRVWDKVQAQRANNKPNTLSIYELLAYTETGHEKRLDTFFSLPRSTKKFQERQHIH